MKPSPILLPDAAQAGVSLEGAPPDPTPLAGIAGSGGPFSSSDRETGQDSAGGRGDASASPEAPPEPAPARDAWASLRPLALDPAVLRRNRVVTAGRSDPAFGAFDVLRTKLVQAMSERGWRRVGVTSPTRGCGKSFLAVNLAVALSRYHDFRTVLMDMDLRLSSVARLLGVQDPEPMGEFLLGQRAPEEFFRRVGPNPLHIGPFLAIGPNGRAEDFAAEIFFDSRIESAFARMDAALDPSVVLMDLPPILAQDDVLALRPHLDCVIMVARGGRTSARELREASRRLGEAPPILGVVLNNAEGEEILDYRY